MVTNMFIAPRFAALHHAGKMDDLKKMARMATRLMVRWRLGFLTIG